MRHHLTGRQLSRNSSHRHAMLRNMSVSLLRHADLGPRFKARPGGYTRILRMLPRPGDSAPMALMQLVDGPVAAAADEAPAAKKKGGRRTKKAEAADAAEAAPKRARKKAAA